MNRHISASWTSKYSLKKVIYNIDGHSETKILLNVILLGILHHPLNSDHSKGNRFLESNLLFAIWQCTIFYIKSASEFAIEIRGHIKWDNHFRLKFIHPWIKQLILKYEDGEIKSRQSWVNVQNSIDKHLSYLDLK